jgi:precorrin-2 dehydrogenase/sirohydrochlorin ferrochelatase
VPLHSSSYFPVFLNLADRLTVVVGGGPVGRRKAEALLTAGARVRLVCLEEQPPALRHPQLDWRREEYGAAHLDGAALVFAAGPPELNARVAEDARARGLWVCSASDPGAGDFILPATVRRGDFVLAVGTGGSAPALARTVRQRLEAEFDHAFTAWVGLLAQLRPRVLRIANPERRRALFARLSAWEWLEQLRRDGPEPVRAAMHAEIEAGEAAQE